MTELHNDEAVYDAIVLGLGAMGSAACYQLAKAKVKVLGIDRYAPPHMYGSSHGETRISRLANGEGTEYVPLVTRSHEIWRQLEQETGYSLLNQCGGLILGNLNIHGLQDFMGKQIACAEACGIEYEILSANQIRERFKPLQVTDGDEGYYEPEAGYLRPERCVRAQLERAQKLGASIKTNERVVNFVDNGSFVTVRTTKATYKAAKLILVAGPWIGETIPEYKHLFKTYRQVNYWYELQDQSRYDDYAKLPIFIWGFGDKPEDSLYGCPLQSGSNGGVRVGTENCIDDTTPDEMRRSVTPDEITHMYASHIAGRLPGVGPRCLRTAVCLYTVTPDHNFIIDVHPQHKNVIVASPCSGHGFKHSAAIGEVLAQLATQGYSTIDISTFSLGRFQ